MNQISVDKMKSLLENLKKIPIIIQSEEPSFMDISGYPHYENVCSNILQFFFKTDEVHGMKDLFICALFKAAGQQYPHELSTNDVLREQPTLNNNRLDIVIETDEFLIGIENKIFAQLYNDLDDYSQFLDSKVKAKSKVIKILLALREIPNNQGFIPVTYEALFQCINDLIGQYWAGANPKYLVYLKDFMQTITKLGRGREMNQELMEFFKANLEDAESFIISINELKSELREQTQNLGKAINFDDKRCKQWFYREGNGLFDTLVHDINVGDSVVAIDAIVNPKGWKIKIFLRKSGVNQLRNLQEFVDWLAVKGVPKTDLIMDGNRLYDPNGDYQGFDETSIRLNDLISKICS